MKIVIVARVEIAPLVNLLRTNPQTRAWDYDFEIAGTLDGVQFSCADHAEFYKLITALAVPSNRGDQ